MFSSREGTEDQETIQITGGTTISIQGGFHVNHKIYGEESIRHSTLDTRIFDWNWDAKRLLRNITTPQFIQVMWELEHKAGVISFETEDILQQVDSDIERHESNNLFG